MKYIVFTIMLSLLFFSITPVLALETGLNYGTFTGLGTKDVREGVMTIINVLFLFLGIIVIVGIIYGGFLIMISGGNSDQNDKGKKIITASVIGLVIIFSAYAIATFVINQLITATGADYAF